VAVKRHFTFSQPTPFQLPTLPRISASTRLDFSKTVMLYKSCTYLLTYLQCSETRYTVYTNLGIRRRWCSYCYARLDDRGDKNIRARTCRYKIPVADYTSAGNWLYSSTTRDLHHTLQSTQND